MGIGNVSAIGPKRVSRGGHFRRPLFGLRVPVTISVRFCCVVVCRCVIWRFCALFCVGLLFGVLCACAFFLRVSVRFVFFVLFDLFVVCGAVSVSYLLVSVSRGWRLFSFLIYAHPLGQAC